MCVVCSTFKCLLYSNVATHEHFEMMIATYHRVTHRSGRVSVRDRFVLRRVTDSLRDNVKVFNAFSILAHPASFHEDDLKLVFNKYIARVETMVGNELASQLMRDLRMSEIDTLESLRQLKRKKRSAVKGAVVGGSQSKGKVDIKSKKKRKRRKKKGW